MASPLLHSYAGFLFFKMRKRVDLPRNFWKSLLGIIVLANLPDIDLLPTLLGFPIRHGVYTHNLVFAFLVGIIVGSWEKRRFSFGFLTFLLVFSHLVIDFMTGPHLGFLKSEGIPWSYPFYGERLSSPVTIFLGVRYKASTVPFLLRICKVFLTEVTYIGLILGVGWLGLHIKKYILDYLPAMSLANSRERHR
jgi:inner membrane protein